MANDRSDCQYAIKELSRAMAAPSTQDERKLLRFARYLVDKARHQIVFRYQANLEGTKFAIRTWSDTDFAGCKATRKSTSGGVIQFGSHTIKTWSSTQSVIALSSGEAEYYGLVKASAQSIGMKAMLLDYGVTQEVSITVRSDSSAAISIAQRKGFGKVRHIEVNQLWLQEKVSSGVIRLIKVAGTENAADHLTKPGCTASIKQHMQMTGQRFAEGRHDQMPSIAK